MAETVENSANAVSDTEQPEAAPEVQARVKRWTKNIQAAKEYWEKRAFKRMRICMQLARDGAEKTWVDAEMFVVPIINRHINQAVSQLYAKNPKAEAKRKPRRMHTIWDGKLGSLQEAAAMVQAAAQQTAQFQQATASGMAAPAPPPVDPNAVAILQDAMGVKQYNTMMDGIAETLTLLHNHYMSEKSAQYKQHFKSLVRRTKVCGVGYVKLGFQRILEPNPDMTAKVADATEQVQRIERLMLEQSRGAIGEDSEKLDEFKTMLADLQSQATLVVQEGPLFTFAKSTAIIPDPNTTHLKTWTGAGWVVEEFDMTPARIEEIYKVDVRKDYKKYAANDTERPRLLEGDADVKGEEPAKVWRVMCRDTGQEFTLCDGYCDWLKPPARPELTLSRFYDIFPLVFNETEEDDGNIFSPSDVWQARHIQSEYNRAREGLRQHRQQNKPAYIMSAGGTDAKDVEQLSDHQSGAVIILNQLAPGEDVNKKIMAKPTVPITPELYDVAPFYDDLLRTVGTQQANLGGTAGDTATEASIAEQSRTVATSDNVDDLDDLLSLLSDSMAEVMLRELSVETVQRIVGPGAVWPQDEDTRSELIEDITVDIRAGSSGRPNQAAELAKMERAMPFLLQLPNINPIPPAEKYMDLLDIGLEDAIIEGLPSITAMNQMMSKPAAQPGTGDPATDPGAQGAKGGDNAEKPGENEAQSQPAYPTSVTQFDQQGNPV